MLNVMPEGYLKDLPAAVGDIEEAREREHQVPEEKITKRPFH